jgi:hypothetical protein
MTKLLDDVAAAIWSAVPAGEEFEGAPYAEAWPEQKIYKEAEARAAIAVVLQAVAVEVGCSCGHASEVRTAIAKYGPNSAERWHACGQSRCGVVDAAAILALGEG